MRLSNRRIIAWAACALVAGGMLFWAGLSSSKKLSSAAREGPAQRVGESLRPARRDAPSADAFLAGKPPPGHGYAVESDAALMDVIRKLVVRSPEDALKWAHECHEDAWRIILAKLVVHTWAENDPAAALTWASVLSEPDRSLALEAALTGSAQHPDVAVALTEELLAAHPELAGDCGTILVGALIRNGNYSAAAAFARDGPAELRDEWIATVYGSWAQTQPEAAARALDALNDANLHDEAWQVVMTGWAQSNPASLANYALTQTSGDTQTQILDAVYDKWCRQDPLGLAAWLARLPPSPERDAGAETFLADTDRADRDTSTALSWAESIGDSGQRFGALSLVTQEWSQQDPAGAQRYVENSPLLNRAQRAWLGSVLSAR